GAKVRLPFIDHGKVVVTAKTHVPEFAIAGSGLVVCINEPMLEANTPAGGHRQLRAEQPAKIVFFIQFTVDVVVDTAGVYVGPDVIFLGLYRSMQQHADG